jgi:hypothetical protein
VWSACDTWELANHDPNNDTEDEGVKMALAGAIQMASTRLFYSGSWKEEKNTHEIHTIVALQLLDRFLDENDPLYESVHARLNREMGTEEGI